MPLRVKYSMHDADDKEGLGSDASDSEEETADVAIATCGNAVAAAADEDTIDSGSDEEDE